MSVSVSRHQNFVGGEWVDAVEGGTAEILNPATGETIAEVPRGTEADVDRAVEAAQRGLPEWRETTPQERAEALLALADALGVDGKAESGLIEVPAGTNARGLREVGCAPNLRPGLAEVEPQGRAAPDIARALSNGDLNTLVLLGAEPVRDFPEQQLWEKALDGASMIAFAAFRSEALEEHADVVFPAEAYAEKEGTVTHTDGRLQRVRQAIGHPGQVRPVWSVLAELCNRLGAAVEATSAPAVTAELASAIPFYRGVTLEEIGGKGVRWQERDAASSAPSVELPETPLETPPEPAVGLRLGSASTLWSGREAEHSPSLRFLLPRQRAELSPEDARRLGISPGEEVVVSADGRSVRAAAAVRSAMPAGSLFLIAGTAEDNATVLADGAPRTVEVRKA